MGSSRAWLGCVGLGCGGGELFLYWLESWELCKNSREDCRDFPEDLGCSLADPYRPQGFRGNPAERRHAVVDAWCRSPEARCQSVEQCRHSAERPEPFVEWQGKREEGRARRKEWQGRSAECRAHSVVPMSRRPERGMRAGRNVVADGEGGVPRGASRQGRTNDWRRWRSCPAKGHIQPTTGRLHIAGSTSATKFRAPLSPHFSQSGTEGERRRKVVRGFSPEGGPFGLKPRTTLCSRRATTLCRVRRQECEKCGLVDPSTRRARCCRVRLMR